MSSPLVPSFTYRSVCQILIYRKVYLGSSFRFLFWGLGTIHSGSVVVSWFMLLSMSLVSMVSCGLEQPALFAIARFANHGCIFIYLHKICRGIWIGSFYQWKTN